MSWIAFEGNGPAPAFHNRKLRGTFFKEALFLHATNVIGGATLEPPAPERKIVIVPCSLSPGPDDPLQTIPVGLEALKMGSPQLHQMDRLPHLLRLPQ